jgi:putative oxidoreductase
VARPTARRILPLPSRLVSDRLDVALLVLRLAFGVGLAAHGYNKVFRGGRLPGTGRWFASIGMKWPQLQARLAAATEIGAGLLFAAGLLTPFAAAGMIGVMTVAFWAAHRHNGFFITKEGWEFVAAISVVAWAVATIGPVRLSLDHALDIEWTGWTGALIAGLLGIGAGIAQLAVCYRPART